MCLARKDYLSRYIIQQGRWRDCDSYVRMWRDLARGQPHDEAPGVILEIGANIGACTVELLLRTDARILAFEPSAANAYYLTRSLKMLASKRPDVAGRVVVFPLGLGDSPMRVPMFAPGENLGNTMHLSLSSQTQGEGQRHTDHRLPIETTVLPLSWLLPRGLGAVTLWKMDVQGYECKVMRGAWPLFAQPHLARTRLRLVATEMSPKHLHSQCCNGLYLAHMLRAIGVARAVAMDKRDPVTQRAVCAGILFGNDSFNRRRLCAHFGASAREREPSDGQPWAVTCIRPPSYWLKRNKETTCIARRPSDLAGGVLVPPPPPVSTVQASKGAAGGDGAVDGAARVTARPVPSAPREEKGLRLAHETPDLPPRLAWQRTKLARRWIDTCEEKERRTLLTIAAEGPRGHKSSSG